MMNTSTSTSMSNYNKFAKSVYKKSDDTMFEIHKFVNEWNVGKRKAVKDMFKQEKLWFANKDYYGKYSCIRTAPSQEHFREEKYFIREGKFLRFPTGDEEHKIDTGLENDSLLPKVGEEIQHNSYGRMVAAKARATHFTRISYFENVYYKIFTFELKDKRVKVQSYIDDEFKTYNQIYKVTTNCYSSSINLKKIFEVLQVYNSKRTSEDNKINGSIPLLITLYIGGQKYKFMLSEWPMRGSEWQVSISVISNDEDSEGRTVFKGQSYALCLGSIIKLGRSQQSRLAKLMLNFLNLTDVKITIREFMGWKSFTLEVTKSAVELLAITQLAEAHSQRTPGMNKLARKAFNKISKGKSSFASEFIPGNFNTEKFCGYPPIGDKGKERAKEAVEFMKREGMQSHDMSDDSDVEEKLHLELDSYHIFDVLEYDEDISEGEDEEEYEEGIKLFFESTSDHECGLLQYEEMDNNI
ncbi:MAG: hypothetical protein ACK4M7_03585 [Burkholderiales bacterium]